MPIATEQIRQERMAAMESYIIAGMSLVEIKRFVLTPRSNFTPWDVSERMIETYYKQARKNIMILPSREEMRQRLALALERYDACYTQSWRIKDFRTCAMINKQAADLLSLPDVAREILDVEEKPMKIEINFKELGRE